MASNTKHLTATLALLLGLVLVLFVVVIYSAAQPTLDAVDWTKETYHVKQGDTLWAIARRYCPDDVDCREWIDAVQALNELGAHIYPGQELTVLAAKEG